MKNTIAFATATQAAIFANELQGQLSDGYWENTRPYDHWKIWCLAEVVVDEDNVGKNFYPMKENYNFASRDLIKYVGGRMIGYARATLIGLDADSVSQIYCFIDIETGEWNYDRDSMAKYASKSEYWVNKLVELDRLMAEFEQKNGRTLRSAYNQAGGQYAMKSLRKDLNAIKQACRTMVR